MESAVTRQGPSAPGIGPSQGISAVINTLNEEANIAACIESLNGLADEIVVCDMHSDDGTAAIASEMGARVIQHDRTGYVEPARKFAIEQADREWVLILDADERMTPALASKLREIAEENTCDVVSFWILYWYFTGWTRHGGFFPGSIPRFFRKSVYLDLYDPADERVHRNFMSLTSADRQCRLSDEYHALHLAYPTIEKYVSKTLGMYARIEAEQYVAAGRRFSLVRMLGEPVREFLVRFVLRQGFRDGMRGFVLVCLYAGFRFCVWANVWAMESDHAGSDDGKGREARR